jgi:hypothetical protein
VEVGVAVGLSVGVGVAVPGGSVDSTEHALITPSKMIISTIIALIPVVLIVSR